MSKRGDMPVECSKNILFCNIIAVTRIYNEKIRNEIYPYKEKINYEKQINKRDDIHDIMESLIYLLYYTVLTLSQLISNRL